MMENALATSQNRRYAVHLIALALFIMAVKLGLLVALFTGLLSYGLVIHSAKRLRRTSASVASSHWIAASLVASAVVMLLVGGGAGVYAIVVKNDFSAVMAAMGGILTSARTWLPSELAGQLPDRDRILADVGHWLSANASVIGAAGLGTLKVIGYALLGVLLGAMIAVSEISGSRNMGPLSTLLFQQVVAIREVFWRVAGAQVKISGLNTALTAMYLLVLLPLVGVSIPYAKTLVIVTFLAGLLPVVGNLISNFAIVVISISQSPLIALVSLAFLVVVHKLEYFVNARIVGGEIQAKAWELLLAIVVMERLFGPAGVVSAPVVYAWVKNEWIRWDTGHQHDAAIERD